LGAPIVAANYRLSKAMAWRSKKAPSLWWEGLGKSDTLR
jgi:hypothetical protein